MKYKVVTGIPVFDNTLWIVRKNATEYIFKTTKPTTEITDAKYQNYCNYNDKTKYKYHGLSPNNAKVNSVSPDRYPFAYSDNVQYILTNDGLLLLKFNSQYLLFDLLNINAETEKLEKLPPTETFINENSLKYLLDWTANKEGFYSRFWNFIHVYKNDDSQIEYHRTKQFATNGYTYYLSFLDELDDIETNLGSIFFKVATENYAETESMFRKYPKDFYIIESDAELTISVYYITNSETLNGNISTANDNIVTVTNDENNKQIYLIKLLKNNDNFDDIDRVGFKFKSSGNPTYIKII